MVTPNYKRPAQVLQNDAAFPPPPPPPPPTVIAPCPAQVGSVIVVAGAFPAAIRIYVALTPVDMRKQYDGLWAAAPQQFGENPKDGAALPARVMAATTEEVQQLREENALLRAQIAWLKQQLFGPGRSEKLDRAQLLLQLGELEKLAAAPAGDDHLRARHGPGPKTYVA